MQFTSIRRGQLYTQIVAVNRLAQALRDQEATNKRAQADILNAILALIEQARDLTEAEMIALHDVTAPAPSGATP